jgi:hypothetical protein
VLAQRLAGLVSFLPEAFEVRPLFESASLGHRFWKNAVLTTNTGQPAGRQIAAELVKTALENRLT